MKKKSPQSEKPPVSKKLHTKSDVNGDHSDYTLFNKENLPSHHYDTVKEWLEKLGTETLIFVETVEKKLKQTKQEKLFKSKTYFNISDINNVLYQYYKILDYSVSGLLEFKVSIDEYISTWKVALKDGIIDESSDSSIEIVTDPVPKAKDLKVDDLLSDEINNGDFSKDSTTEDTKSDEKVCKLRIRKPSELNRLAEEEASNGSASQLSNSAADNKVNTSSSDECIICSNDESDNKVTNNDKIVIPTKKLNLSVSKLDKKKEEVKNDDSKSSKSKENLDDVHNISSDESSICSDGEANKTPKVEPKPEKVEDKPKINWDTSTEASTDRDWIVSNKKSDKKEDNKKKKLLSKKERTKKRKNIFSSSDDEDVNKLCNLNNLKKRKRTGSCSSSKSSGSEAVAKCAEKKSDSPKKTKKDEVTLEDCFNASSSDSSVSSTEMTFELESIKHFKSLRNDSPKIEEFGEILPESENEIPVLTDSSLDSIAELLTKKKLKVSRGTSKKKSDGEKKTKVRKRQRDKLLEAKLTDTDTTEGEERYQKNKMKTRIDSSDSEEEVKPIKPSGPKTRTTRNSAKGRKSLFSDSDDNLSQSESSNDKEKSEDEEDKDKKDESEEEKKTENKKKRKRIQKQSDSSDEDNEPTPSKSDGKGRRNIRKVLKEESLEKTTKEALKEEEERKKRIAEKQKMYNHLININAHNPEDVKVLDELVLDFDVETKEPLVSVDKDLVKKLKPHQAEGIKFMWDSCFESVKHAKEGKGSGCILAHCMGLGKTLQVITLVHTLLTCENVDVNRVLVVCPFSTVQNWVNEFRKWLKDIGSGEDIEIYNMIKTAVSHRSYQLRDWERTGGVMVLGYNLFRTLVTPKGRMKASVKKAIEDTLIDPGPDVVVCDEGHILKNEKTAIAKAMSKLKTRRRIVLTGTPLQNNLVEYHCMVQFVKPNLLGTRKEFQNRFVHPIQNGQFEDSTAHDVKIMKRRAHVLHKMLDGIVQRKDYSVLTPYLPPKYEYVIHVKLTDVQCKLYRYYLEHLARKSKNEGGGLFQDFQHLMRICTHPRSLLIHSDKEQLKREFEEDDSEGSLKDFIDDGSDSDEASSDKSSSSKSGDSGSERSRSKSPPKRKNTRASRAAGNVSEEEEEELPAKRTEWWSDMVTEEELQDIKSSSKLFLFFTILKHSEEIGDKLLVFSQSLYTLDLIEHFLELVDANAHKSEEERNPLLSEFNSNWDKGLDYFRLDGTTTSDCRANWCKVFNQASNTRARLFLISTRAGGLGINLTGANRVIIFDASWNPSYDVQSIFRVYRFGQEKPCYIYRFLSKGTMEEKIYERQVAKLSTSLRVIDEQQIDRHFTQTSLAELYVFNPDPPESRETPILPKDRLMAELLQSYPDMILNHHQHDSLLENQEDEELNEEERKAAWQEFENEKNNVPPPSAYTQGYNMPGYVNPNSFLLQQNIILNSLVEKIRQGNPSLSEELVRKRSLEVLSTIWQQQQVQQQQMQQQQQQQQQQNFMNNYNYVQQQQQQFYMQQQQQQRFMNPQKQLPGVANTYSKAGPAMQMNGAQAQAQKQAAASSGKSTSNVGGPSQPIEIQDDE